MEKKEVYITYDNEIHKSKKVAEKHLDEQFGKIICSLSIKLCQINKYDSTIIFLEDNLEEFRKALKIKDNSVLSNEDYDFLGD